MNKSLVYTFSATSDRSSLQRLTTITSQRCLKASRSCVTSLPKNSDKARKLVRYFMSGTVEVEIDKQGRILLPAQLREIAGIDKNVVFVGMGTRGELWSEEAYNAYETETTTEEINSISEELLDSGFQI